MSVDLDGRITLAPHAALKNRTEGDILVLPERAIRLGGSSGQILRLCDGERTVRDVISAMRDRYPHDSQIDDEVAAFISEMCALGGIVLEAPSSGENDS